MSDIPADLAAALSGRFELRQVLGRGGMATVYLATDHKHEREVAVKVLLPGLAAFLGTERFLTEIQIAARLNHPHILSLHDSGEAGGFLYYVMPYIDGGSLRQRIAPEGGAHRPSAAEALEILRPVADALSYAHRMGVLHRDIKPENILFSQGHPIVADFGIARAVTTAGGAHLTRTGFPIGTPGYMSPEQAAGLTDLDARADVYSLAVVSYELLVGELPGRWPTEEAVRTGRFSEIAPQHRSRLTALGSPIEGALIRGLSVRADQRTATPAALVAELQGEAPRRRFSEGEVQEIVKRATELEATNPTQSGAMTIGGVEALAAEVGIEPRLVRQAAGAVASSRPGTPAPPLDVSTHNRVIGGPTRLFFEREVEGELPDAEFPTLVEEIRRMLSDVGQVNQLGHSFSWISTRGGGRTRDLEISVSVRQGRTKIRARENLNVLIGATFGGIGGGMGGGGMGPIMGTLFGGLHLAGALAFFAVPVWLGITYLTARTVYGRSVKKRVAGMAPLVDRLAELTRELVPSRPRLEA